MNGHLADDVLVEMAEAGASDPHLADCARCRSRFDDVRDALHLAGGVEVPEPSPLFWDHLSARVRASIAAEPGRSEARQWLWLGQWGWQPALAVLVLVVAGTLAWQANRGVRTPPGRPPAASVQQAAAGEVPEADMSWSLVTDAASDVDLETAMQAVHVTPVSADLAARTLSPREQRELVRLLQAAVERDGTE